MRRTEWPVQEKRTDKEWEELVKGLLKAELKRRGITYAQLVGKLADIGVADSEPNIRNKLARGKFKPGPAVRAWQTRPPLRPGRRAPVPSRSCEA